MKEQKQPLISVIIPVYNGERYLERCVRSVCVQNYKDLEILLINDGSTDRSPAICEKLAEEDRRIRVFHRKNGGVSAARNDGIRASTGEYIVFVDSDDWVEIEHITSLYEAASRFDADIACAPRFVDIPGRGNPKDPASEPFCLPKDDAMASMLRGKYGSVYATAKLFRRELMNNHFFPEGEIYEDLRIMFYLFADACRVAFTEQRTMHYFQREGSIVHSDIRPELVEDLLLVCRQFITASSSKKIRRAAVYRLFVQGEYFCRRADVRIDPRTRRIIRHQLRAYRKEMFCDRENTLRRRIAWWLFTSNDLFMRLVFQRIPDQEKAFS